MTLRNAGLVGMRKWPIKGFDNHLIFDLSRPDGICVVRVLHAARDWWRVLGVEAG